MLSQLLVALRPHPQIFHQVHTGLAFHLLIAGAVDVCPRYLELAQTGLAVAEAVVEPARPLAEDGDGR
jgi:hypothetical protein